MRRLTQLDLWLAGKVLAWWRRRRRKGRHRTDGVSTMRMVKQLQVSR